MHFFPEKVEVFYPLFHHKYKKPTRNRRGERFFQNIAKDLAKEMGLENFSNYSHHSFRRSSATSLHQQGKTKVQIMHLGGWQSDKVVEGYIAESNVEKRSSADALQLSTDSKKKRKRDREDDLSGIVKKIKAKKVVINVYNK